MTTAQRIALAIAIVVVDVVLFALPITGLLAAWVLLARPPWFRRWVEDLYAATPPAGD